MLKREQIIKLASHLMFELSDEEISAIEKEFEIVSQQVARFQQFNTEDVQPMVYPFEGETTYLREDDDIRELSLEDVLMNAPEKQDEYFVVPKVVD